LIELDIEQLYHVPASDASPFSYLRYIATVEERVFVEGPQRRIPDVWVQRHAAWVRSNGT
jgi:hypothetical protein